jgi:hypothetical protein
VRAGRVCEENECELTRKRASERVNEQDVLMMTMAEDGYDVEKL